MEPVPQLSPSSSTVSRSLIPELADFLCWGVSVPRLSSRSPLTELPSVSVVLVLPPLSLLCLSFFFPFVSILGRFLTPAVFLGAPSLGSILVVWLSAGFLF